MRSKRTKRFRTLFATLPEDIQRQADKAYQQFKADSTHPGLDFK